MSYLAFVISDQSRAELLKQFTPLYPKVVCHHVTILFPTNASQAIMVTGLFDKMSLNELDVTVDAIISDGKAEAFRVVINGDVERPMGGFYHLTYSLMDNVKPVHSNKLFNSPLVKIQHIQPIKLSGKLEIVK